MNLIFECEGLMASVEMTEHGKRFISIRPDDSSDPAWLFSRREANDFMLWMKKNIERLGEEELKE